MKERLVIYHGPECPDGFTAAWACYGIWADSADYVPAAYGDAPPDVAGKDVLVVDFSYPREALIEMASKAKRLRVFDHHEGAQRALDGLDFCTFDMNRSGAGITWDVLHGPLRPRLIDLVEDRDLWRWELTNSKAISAFIGTIEKTFANWGGLATDLEGDDRHIVAGGNAILRHIDAYVDATARHARKRHIEGYDVPFVNAPGMMVSELVGKLAESAPFAVGWHELADGRYKYSLRSRGKDGVDVSRIAERFGGSGHRPSAGFTLALPPTGLFAEVPHGE